LCNPVDRVGDEGSSVEKEPEELCEDRQCAAEHIEHCTSGVIGSVEESTDALQPRHRIPPAVSDEHLVVQAGD
jgi:hypothetical protein